ncbi:hypothetical protein HXX76_015181 [Chlamydomonas incerta]|uniref:Uncharacterized protein n=1 Tax=Chlamydomonas incerta TaxID=51695 RepID=A0A835SJT2_CHLIN|nr:hypothetical protein HXX76_015181 [Chlamydomonas incerta]|eukprot:KAG2423664.1 hypothetical protein HXX76_015181 [Chlamydomonas incerta]
MEQPAEKQGDVWSRLTPDVIRRIASFVHPNEAAAHFKFTSSDTAASLRNLYKKIQLAKRPAGSTTPQAHQHWPGHEFARHWGRPEPWRELSLPQRKRMLCLAASSGHAASLEAALSHCGCSMANNVLNNAVSAAALAGSRAACERLLFKADVGAVVAAKPIGGAEGGGEASGVDGAGGRSGDADSAGSAAGLDDAAAHHQAAKRTYRAPPEEALANAACAGHLPVLQLLLEAAGGSSGAAAAAAGSSSSSGRLARQQRLSHAAQAACHGGQRAVLEWLEAEQGHEVGFAEVVAAAKAGQVELMEWLLQPLRRHGSSTRTSSSGVAGGGGTAAAAVAAAPSAAAPAAAAGGVAAALRAALAEGLAAAMAGMAAAGGGGAQPAVGAEAGAAAAAGAVGPAPPAPPDAAAGLAAALAAALAGVGQGAAAGEGQQQQEGVGEVGGGALPPPQWAPRPPARAPPPPLQLTSKQQLELLCALANGCPLEALQRHYDDLWVPYASATAGAAAWAAAGGAGAAELLPMALWPAASDLLVAAVTSRTACWEDKWLWLWPRAGGGPGGAVLQRMLVHPGPHNRAAALEAACGPLPGYCQRLRVLHAAGMPPSPNAAEWAVQGGHADALAYLWDEAGVECRAARPAFASLVMSHAVREGVGSLPVLQLLAARGMAFTATHVRQTRANWPSESLVWLIAQVPRPPPPPPPAAPAPGEGTMGEAFEEGSGSNEADVDWSAAFRHAARKGHGLEVLLPLCGRGVVVDLASVAEGGSEAALEWAVRRLEEDQGGRPAARLRVDEAQRVAASGNTAAAAWLAARHLNYGGKPNT